MPDVTVSFTDEQWVRVVAASSFIIRSDEGPVSIDKLAAKFKANITDNVKAYEESKVTVDDF
jgi:hypothetical protein